MSSKMLKDSDTVVGELLNLAVSNIPARKTFSSYKIDAVYETNLEALRKLSCKELEEAATLLGAEPLVGDVKRYKNRCTLAEWIIMRIVALFPYRCGSCQEGYQVDRLAIPKRRCHNCGQGSHDCPKFLEADKALEGNSIPGLV